MDRDTGPTDLSSAAQALLTIEELARATGLHPGQIEVFVRFGLVEPASGGEPALFAVAVVGRLRSIARLRRDLGVNLAGVAAILEMQERMAELQREVERLQRLLGLED
jgi:MerR family transcriptional regulator, heat shock protein HspR